MTTYSAQSIVFIDSRVPDLQDLLDGVEPGDLVFVLDPNSDGVQQIADILAANNVSGLASISIVAHGAPGEIEIGSTLLNDANLASHSAALAEIGSAMAPGGNLLLYGCDVGSGAAGTQFINDLSSLTSGTVVGAATHDVGSAADGGTWTLDASTGTLTQGAPFTDAALSNFQGLLPVAGTVELWVASTAGGNDNGLFHADDTGTGTASNTTTLFSPTSANNPTGVSHLTDVALDTQNGRYFLDFSDDTTGKWIVQASLSQALASPGATPTFTTLYHDTSASEIENIAADDAGQKLYLIEGNRFESLNYNAANQAPTTLGTAADVSGGPAFIDGMALDASHNSAYFFTNQVTTTAEFTGPSSSIIIFNTVAKQNGLYIDSNINNTGTTLTQLPISPDDATTDGNNFPTSLGLISGIAVDKVHQVLYFTTDQLSGGTGGIYKYNLTSNTSGTYAAVWVEPTNGTQVLSHIAVDPTTGKYYVSDDADHSVLVGDLNSTLAPTTFLTLPTGAPQLEPLGLALDNAPTLALTASNAAWTEDGANASLVSSAAATDPDNTSLTSGKVSITTGFRSGDTLTFSTAGTSITGSYNSSTGLLTLSGLDSFADYQTVLQSVQYHGGENPTDFSRTDTSRTVTWTVNDGLLTSAPQTASVSVIFVNDPPTLAGLTTASWTEEGSNATLSSGASVTDPDDLGLSSATVAITGGTFVGDADILAANVAGTNITANYNTATETLTLSGSDTLAHYQSVLDSVTFHAGENPTNFGADPTRTVTWTLTDPSGTANGGIDTSATTSTINVVRVNDAPTLSNVVASAQYTEEGGATTLSSAVTVTDPDDLNLTSATVAITGGTFAGDGDVLAANVTGTNITANYNSATETLTLAGSDSLANYQSVLDSVTFSAGENPNDFGSNPTRTITWQVNDGGGTANGGVQLSNIATTTVNITNVNDPPTLANVAATTSFTEEGGPATLSNAVSVSDPDSLNLANATVQITGGTFAGDGDVLAANVTGTNITANYNTATETLTLAGSDTLAHYQSVLDSVTFNAGENPNNFGANPTRTVTWTLNDGSGSFNLSAPQTTTVNITNVNDAPTLSNVAASAQYTEEGAATTLSSAVTVTDVDDHNLSSATVAITGGTFAGDGDVLAANVAGTNITANYNTATETLALSGTDSLANYQTVLDSVTFSAGENPNDFGSNPTRTITWQVNDGGGTANGGVQLSNVATTTVNITNVNDPPTLANVAATASFTEEGGPATLSNAVSVSDPDSLNLANATVQITGGTFAGDGDVLAANVTGTNITANYNTASETLTLSGTDSLAHYQSVLDSVTFNAGENPNDFGSNPTRTVTWTLNDGSGSFNLSAPQTTTVNITNVNDAPTLSNVAASAQYTEEGAATTLSSAVTVTDPDSLTLAGATVAITGGTFAGDGDVLAANAAGTNITVNYNSTTETLTLSGNDTLANYQTVLDSVTFSAGENPTDFGSNQTRTVTWVANDGSGSFNLSNVATTTVAVTGVNDPPTLSNVAASANFTQGGGAVTLSGAASASDPDNLTLTNATVQITGGTFAGDGDVLAANTTGTNITASYNAATETLTLTGSDTLAHYSQVLDSVTFNSTSGNPTDFGADPTRTVTWVVNDGSGSFNLSAAQTETININNVNDAPTLSGVAASASYTEQSAATTLSGNVTVGDPDDTMLASATVSITGGTFAGDGDVLATSTAGTSITASYDSTNERLVLSGTDTLADYQSVLDKVTFSEAGDNPTNYGSNPTRTISWVLNDGHASNNLSTAQTETLNVIGVNDQPTLANVAATVGFLPHHTITISPSIAVSDPDNLTLANATVRITAGTFAGDGDVLAANVSGTSITASYNAATETLTLSGVDTVAHYQSVLDSVTFSSGNNPSHGNTNRTRTVTWVVNDGGGSNNLSTAATTTISIGGSVARNDFDGDGDSDLLLQFNPNSAHPDVKVEVLNGTTITSSGTTSASKGWAVVAAGHFNDDADSDIVMQNSDGTPQIWLMNGTSLMSSVTLANPGSSWHIIAAADFNNDGNDDLLFQNTNGSAQIWEMNGTSVVTTAVVGNPGSSWRVIGAGDFNGDGNADILWQNSNGTPMIWEMNGTSVVASATLSNPGSSWQAIGGIGDFNGDGMADILFQKNDGTPMIWEMNGTSVVASAMLANPGSQYQALGTNDFNADGMADILFQRNNGIPLVYEMNGTSVATSFTLPNPGAPWHLEDDGPIPLDQMGAGSAQQPTMHASAPDASAVASLGGSTQLNNQHLTSLIG